MAYQIETKDWIEYVEILTILKELKYDSDETLDYMLSVNDYFKWIVVYLDSKDTGGNYECASEYEIITKEELFDLIEYKKENEVNEIIIAGLAKKTEQNLANLGIKCADNKVIKAIIGKEALKANYTVGEAELLAILALVNIGECKEEIKLLKVNLSIKEEPVEESVYNDDLYDLCGDIEDSFDEILGYIDASHDFDDAISELDILKTCLGDLPENINLPITIVDIEAITTAIKVHKSRQEKLDKELEDLCIKISNKYNDVSEELQDIKNKCEDKSRRKI